MLSLLKNYYDEQVFGVLVKDFYNSDPEISLAAIQASGSLGNEVAIPHLYRILEQGSEAQKVAAIRSLAAVNAPSAVERLAKYFTVFPSLQIRQELLRALNSISPMHPKVQELNRAVLLEAATSAAFQDTALLGLVEAGDMETVGNHLLRSAPEAQRLVLKRLLAASGSQSAALLASLKGRTGSLDPLTLGCYLAAYLLRSPAAQANAVYDALRGAEPEATTSFLSSLAGAAARFPNQALAFRLLLRIPYVDAITEAMNGDALIEVVQEVKSQAPLALNELIFTTATHLEAVFAKIRKQHLSLKEVKEKDELLVVILAKIMERYATQELLRETQRFFRAEVIQNPGPLVNRIKTRLQGASPDERNRFGACLPLLMSSDRLQRLNIARTLTRVDLSHPSLLRRLNRLVRVIGTLEIRNSAKKILEILTFAREERIPFLEETCVVTLCQLLNRVAIEQARGVLANPEGNPPSVSGYIRGARFVPAKIFLNPLLKLLLNPELAPRLQALIVDSLERMDLAGAGTAMPPLIRSLRFPEIAAELKTRIASIVARHADASLFQPLLDLTAGEDPLVRQLAARTLKTVAQRERHLPSDVLTNRLYLLLEDGEKPVQIEALLALIGLSDDYAIQILLDHIKEGDEEIISQVLANLERPPGRELLAPLLELLGSESRVVQERLREVMPELCQGEYAQEIRQALLALLKEEESSRGGARVAHRTAAEDIIQHAKLEFKFKRENAQELTVLFTDIVSYTEKSSSSDATTLMKLIQAFEEITLPTIAAFKGTLVKKMGDGLLATFKHPLNAVLAALQIQEKIRGYNEYKTDREKFDVRVGINTGLVIRKDNDVYGDTVNVASRMETSASPGDILLTHRTYEGVREHVRCVRLGDIQVKGKQQAITTYSAEQALVDVQRMLRDGRPTDAEAQRLEAAGSLTGLRESMFSPKFVVPEGLSLDRTIAESLRALFTDMSAAVEDIASDYHAEYVFKRYLQQRWDGLISTVRSPAS